MRGHTGSCHPRGRLTEQDVVTARNRFWIQNESVKIIAADYGLSEKGMREVIRGRRWQHVPMPPESERDPLWAAIDLRGPDECWEWKRYRDQYGYGILHGDRAHRAVWRQTHGAIPHGMEVMHQCDNPSCCNPSHLLLGTHADNMRDMVTKGRSAHGEHHPRAKLSDKDVQEIREQYSAGVSRSTLAKRFGVSDVHIWQITVGKTRCG